MTGYWLNLLYIVRMSDMAGDEPTWLDGRCKELGRLRAKNGKLHLQSSSYIVGYEPRMTGWTQ